MAAPQKPWKAEYAKSARASCRTCKDNINKEVLRLGKMVQSSQFDGFMPMWHHATCIMKKANQIKSVDDVEGIESIRWEDQQKIRKYVDSNVLPSNTVAIASAPVANGIELSQTSRASCKRCSQKITKGEPRISSKSEGQGARGVAWHHAKCFLELFPSTLVEKLQGWESLPSSDQSSLRAVVKGKAPKSTGNIGAKSDGGSLKESKAKGQAKRKIADESEQLHKITKTDADMTIRKCTTQTVSQDKEGDKANLERKLESQSKALWALKDDLKKYVSTAELRQMLEANDQGTSGSELDLRDRCADGMMFGAPEKCPMCAGHIYYSGGTYKCHGYLSEWSKCSYSIPQPVRIKGKWKIPEETDNQYLLKWFKTQSVAKPVRILPPSSSMSTGNQSGNRQPKSSKDERLADLRVTIVGVRKESLVEHKTKLEEAGGQVHPKIKKDTNCLVVGEGTGEQNAEMKKARRMKIPIVREDYLIDSIKRQKKLPFNLYKIESTGESSSTMTVKVKGRSAVHEASGLQDSGHILEDGINIYNTTLSMSDLSSGVNSYYILQIIQDDKSKECNVFRKWGRVGSEKIGGKKLEELAREDAIHEFKRLFLEKTGNPWEAWVDKQNFHKNPGRFFPLEIDYGVNKQTPKKKIDDEKSQLAPPLQELIKMLFNVETYRSAMLEFEINLSEMPLGKLSKSNIQRGFEALTQIQNLIENADIQPSVRDGLIVDASNRFFTMIPSTHPHVIRDEDDFKSKVKMLEALQDIEIASRLVGFDVDSDDSLDDKYKKLSCDISPLPHDSEDYRLIDKYLLTTHAPTHTEWKLELEEVFLLNRPGEFDKFAPHRDKLGNRMLLWHGSRLTNFVGILSQGLRIAPPEAPATGYMFGKGVYFADLVSKSAQYCFTDKKNPVGLMLLSEVALGQVHELKRAQYMDKPPRGKHSTKGLGKKVPDEKGFSQWRDEVVVPCGKPVDSKVKSSELMYNEYIVYDTAQVKMQFLLKVRFQYKR